MVDKKIEITMDEYNELVKDRNRLRALEGAGVDNWEGYDVAMEYYYSQYENDGED